MNYQFYLTLVLITFFYLVLKQEGSETESAETENESQGLVPNEPQGLVPHVFLEPNILQDNEQSQLAAAVYMADLFKSYKTMEVTKR